VVDPTTYAAFLAAVLTMQLLPGPETVLVVSRGIGQGRRVAFWTVFGMTMAAGTIGWLRKFGSEVPACATRNASVSVGRPCEAELAAQIAVRRNEEGGRP
jgi:hypothetical protein